MTFLNISKRDIKNAQIVTKEFDKRKQYEKMQCKNNWIGILGEYKLQEYFDTNKIEYIWTGYETQEIDKPDFIIKYQTIDLKTTSKKNLWIQKPKFDIYILAYIDQKIERIEFIGFITKKEIEYLIKTHQVDFRKRENGAIDYIIDEKHLEPFRELKLELGLRKRKDL